MKKKENYHKEREGWIRVQARPTIKENLKIPRKLSQKFITDCAAVTPVARLDDDVNMIVTTR